MKNLSYILALMLSLGLVLFGCPTSPDDDSADDDTADDDDATPDYTGTIDMANAALSASCVATVESVPNGPTPEGYFDFSIDLEGWASDMWVEMWDLAPGSDYCEGYDPETGDPCVTGNYERPGWDMTNADFGWDSTLGFWDYWELHLEYIMDLAAADAAGKSIFICENAGNNFQTWFCGCDMHTAECFCTEFPMEDW